MKRLLVLCACWLHLGAFAQVWGYVDERGVAHFAAEKANERYELFYRSESAQPPTRSAGRKSPAPSPVLQLDQSGWETPALTGMAEPDTGAVVAPLRLLAYFEVSPAYKAVKHLIREASQAHGIEPELLQAVMAAESGFDPLPISPRGAVGLMQIMPATAQEHGVSGSKLQSVEALLTDPRINIHTGARMLAKLQAQFPERLELAVAAYNAGAGAVRRAGRQVPAISETRKYVQTVLQIYQFLLPPKALQKPRKLP